jgi:hypothetical protein
VCQSEELFHCVHFQASRWNLPDSARFTGNVIAVWPQWHELWTGQPFDAAHTAAPIAHDRVGSLSLGEDTWWQVQADTSLDELGVEVRASVDRACDLFFSRFQNLRTVLTFLESGGLLPGVVPQPLIRAALLVHFSRHSEATQQLRAAREARPDWELVSVVARRLGLSSV